MKNNLYPYKKIKQAVFTATYGIGISLLIGFIAFVIVLSLAPEQVLLSIVVGVCAFAVLCGIIYFTCKATVKQERKNHKKKFIKLTVAQTDLTELFNKNQPEKVNDNSFVYIYQEKMFNTISIYHLEGKAKFKDLKPLRNEVTQFLKDNYKAAREYKSYKRHHELKIQLYVTDKFSKDILKHLTDGKEKMYDIGFIRCYWCVDTQSVWIPFYKGNKMDYHAANNYHKAYKKILKLFNCTYCCETD